VVSPVVVVSSPVVGTVPVVVLVGSAVVVPVPGPLVIGSVVVAVSVVSPGPAGHAVIIASTLDT